MLNENAFSKSLLSTLTYLLVCLVLEWPTFLKRLNIWLIVSSATGNVGASGVFVIVISRFLAAFKSMLSIPIPHLEMIFKLFDDLSTLKIADFGLST